MGDDPTLIHRQRNGRTLSYFCESSESSLVMKHRIIVSYEGRKRRRSSLHYVLLLLIPVCFGSLFSLNDGDFFVGRGVAVLGFLWPPSLPVLFGCLVLFGWILMRKGRIMEEAVVVMPYLGVQLDIVYSSKLVRRRFFPLQNIVAPVINEAVTPVTCYFYLALLLRGEDNLVLAFLGLRPPLRMLVPIWRSLRDAVGRPSLPEPRASEENMSSNAQMKAEQDKTDSEARGKDS